MRINTILDFKYRKKIYIKLKIFKSFVLISAETLKVAFIFSTICLYVYAYIYSSLHYSLTIILILILIYIVAYDCAVRILISTITVAYYLALIIEYRFRMIREHLQSSKSLKSYEQRGECDIRLSKTNKNYTKITIINIKNTSN